MLAGALLAPSHPAHAQAPAAVDAPSNLSLPVVGMLTGAGSTFAFPVIGKWTQLYRSVKSDGAEMVPLDIGVDYEPVGSLGGEVRVTQRAVDFGATDRPVSSEELARSGLIQFPFVMGGIVPVVNIDGIGAGQLRFTGPLLADIYLGKVKTWSDPAIKAVNPDAKLPDAAINVIWRSDGSGTTFNWTDYLSRSSPEWAGRIGANTQVPWPVGAGAERTQGVVSAIARVKNAIGYVELGQVLRASLAYGLVQNRSGQFVRPDAASLQAAAASADWPGTRDFSLMLTDAPGPQSWPIVATTFALVPKPLNARSREALAFFNIAFDKGSGDAAALGYVPLPEPLVRQVRAYWAAALQSGS
jgi:phosphate transport system substrate-binding protein